MCVWFTQDHGQLSSGIRALNSPVGMELGQQGWLLSLGFLWLALGPLGAQIGRGSMVPTFCAPLRLWVGAQGPGPGTGLLVEDSFGVCPQFPPSCVNAPGPQACPCAKLRCSSLGGSLGCCRLWGPCSLYPIPELHSPTSKKDSSCPVVSGALGLAPSPASPHLHLCSLSLCTLGVCGPLWGEVLSAWVSAPAPDFQGGLWTPLVSEAEE